jgi:hypothetical protein
MSAFPHHPQESNLDIPDRRGGVRALKIRSCLYQLMQTDDRQDVEFTDGQALSLNAGSGGYLLLMPQLPETRQVFEIHKSHSVDTETIVLVETCWTQEVPFGHGGKVFLVGVRSLFETAHVTS